MSKLKVLVVGASRGIGLGFVKHYLKLGHDVIATHRDNSRWSELNHLRLDLDDSNRLDLKPLEITDNEAVSSFVDSLTVNPDILIFNAGIWCCPKGTNPLDETTEQYRESLEVNTLAPDNMMRKMFNRLLHPNACVVYLSSTMADYSSNSKGRYSSYRASKIAGNVLFQNWNTELARVWLEDNNNPDERPIAFPISPGVVQTDMAGDSIAPLTVEQSVTGMVSVINTVRQNKHSGFYLYDGSSFEIFPTPSVVSQHLESSLALT